MTDKYEMPALIDEQREEVVRACLGTIKYQSDYNELDVLMAKIALTALTAEPVAKLEIQDGEFGCFIAGEILDKSLEDHSRVLVYTAPPVPALKLPDDVPDLLNLSLEQQTEFNNGFWYGIEKVKRLNGIKNG